MKSDTKLKILQYEFLPYMYMIGVCVREGPMRRSIEGVRKGRKNSLSSLSSGGTQLGFNRSWWPAAEKTRTVIAYIHPM